MDEPGKGEVQPVLGHPLRQPGRGATSRRLGVPALRETPLMPTWDEIRDVLIAEYDGEADDREPDAVAIPEGVFVQRIYCGPENTEWIEICAAIVGNDEADASAVMDRNGEIALGGFVSRAGLIWWRQVFEPEGVTPRSLDAAVSVALAMAEDKARKIVSPTPWLFFRGPIGGLTG
jgi:hypothetical protein